MVPEAQELGAEVALALLETPLGQMPWALYRVRRIYNAVRDAEGRYIRSKKGTVYRAVEKLNEYTEQEDARAAFAAAVLACNLRVVVRGELTQSYVEMRGESYPTREEFYVAAPATVEDKARYGLAWFERLWDQPQGELFHAVEQKGMNVQHYSHDAVTSGLLSGAPLIPPSL
jgi:hypothetical protein